MAASLVSAAAIVHMMRPARAAGPTEHRIVMQDMKFVPETLTAKQGDTLVWVNRDFFPHTATAADRSFDSGNVASGAAWKYVASKRGKFAYVCTLHPTMKAVVVVE